MVIDFRLRPPMKGFLSLILYSQAERTAGLSRKAGLEPAPSLLRASMDLLLQEMKEAEVSTGVVLGRQAGPPWGSVSNDDVATIVQEHPDSFIGMASIDPSNIEQALAECDRAVLKLGLRGIVIDPGMLVSPMYLSDRRIYPVYRRCQELDIPVVLMSGGSAGPDLSYSSPVWIDQVAAEFPGLRLVAAHGCWPWVTEILGVAYRRPNLYVSPDMYLVNMPGALDYVQAANYYLEDRLLFASAYPALPLKGAVDAYRALPFSPRVLDKVLYGNAARLLGLS